MNIYSRSLGGLGQAAVRRLNYLLLKMLYFIFCRFSSSVNNWLCIPVALLPIKGRLPRDLCAAGQQTWDAGSWRMQRKERSRREISCPSRSGPGDFLSPSDVMSERGAIGRYKCAGQITGFELTLTARSPIVSLSQSERWMLEKIKHRGIFFFPSCSRTGLVFFHVVPSFFPLLFQLYVPWFSHQSVSECVNVFIFETVCVCDRAFSWIAYITNFFFCIRKGSPGLSLEIQTWRRIW